MFKLKERWSLWERSSRETSFLLIQIAKNSRIVVQFVKQYPFETRQTRLPKKKPLGLAQLINRESFKIRLSVAWDARGERKIFLKGDNANNVTTNRQQFRIF